MRTWHVIRADGTRIPVLIHGRDVTLREAESDVIEVTLEDVLLTEEEDELDRIVRDVMDDAGL